MFTFILFIASFQPVAPVTLHDSIDIGITQDLGGPKCGNKPEGCPACFICNFNTGACVADENCKGPAPQQDSKKAPKKQ